MKPEEFEGIRRRTETAIAAMNPTESSEHVELHLSLDQLVADNVALVTEYQLLMQTLERLVGDKVALAGRVKTLTEQLRLRDQRLEPRQP